jgi:hypothetical protein
MIMSKRTRTALLALVVVAGVALPGLAPGETISLKQPGTVARQEHDRSIETTVWFQGFLADYSTGEPVDNETYEIVANIYSAASGGVWHWGPETHGAVPISDGWFSIELGSVIGGLPAFDDPPYYLDLTIDGETLDPRLKLASVPSAFQSAAADEPDEDWSFSGSNIYRTTGSVGIGTTTPSSDLDVAGRIETQAFRLTASPGSGHVLTSDSVGNASWQPAGYGDLLPFYGDYSGNDIAFFVEHSGTADYDAGFFTITNPASTGSAIDARSAGSAPVLEVIQVTENPGGGNAAYFHVERPSNDEHVVFTHSVGTGPAYYGGTEGPVAAQFCARDAEDGAVVDAQYTGPPDNWDGIGVYGAFIPNDYYGIGGGFVGGYEGCFGYVQPTGSSSYYGVEGVVNGGTGTNYGVYGNAMGSGLNYAGYFQGNTHVNGTLTKAAGSFKIDHPLDPEGKYLYHSFVESPDMKNVYDGVALLDDSGEAWIELPEWFDALNSDFRYQLTCIGSHAPVYIADEISGNRFMIAGGKPGMKVSWQVTGIRQDRYAQEHRIPVEEDKPPNDMGKYLHPELYGASKELSVSYDPKRDDLRRRLLVDEPDRGGFEQ